MITEAGRLLLSFYIGNTLIRFFVKTGADNRKGRDD